MQKKLMTPICAALLITLSTFAAGCGSTFDASETFEATYSVPSGGEIVLSNTNGSVVVEAWSGDEVQIEAVKKAHSTSTSAAERMLDRLEIEVIEDGGQLRIATRKLSRNGGGWPFGLIGGGSVSYHLRVPADRRVEVVTVNGRVSATGLEAGAKVRSTNGGITLAGCRGPISASTTNGRISAELLGSTTSGELSFTSTNGAIELSVPRDLRASINASTTNGRVRTDLDVDATTSRRTRLEGDINGGGPSLYVRTVNGGIRIGSI